MLKRIISILFALLIFVSFVCASVIVSRAEDQPQAAVNPFIDVPDGKWFTDGVLYCYENGFMTGTGDSTFSPSNLFTRASFVQVLSRIDGVDLSSYTGSSFTDVDENKWYAKATQWAYMTGFASGTGEGIFSPNYPVTRETLAQFLYNYSNRMGFDVSQSVSLNKYSDAFDISPWALNGVKWAVANGLISGKSETILAPKAAASRAEVALIVKKFYTEIYLNGSFLTRNGMRTEVGAYISKIPENDQERVKGGAYFKLYKPSGSSVSFSDTSIEVRIKKGGLEIFDTLSFNGTVYEAGDEVYAEFRKEVDGVLGFVPFKIGEIVTVEVTVNVNGQKTLLTYSVPVREELFVK